MSTHKFEVEYARSGRAACRQCKTKIDKDELRIGHSQEVEAGDDGEKNYALAGTKWYKFECFRLMKGARWFKANLCAPEECSGYDNLKEEDQKKVDTLFKALREGDINAIAGIKRPAADGTDDLQEAVKNQGVLTDEQYESIETYKGEIVKKNANWLKEHLKHNGLPMTGVKAELIEKVAENKVLGVLPMCDACNQKGRLTYARSNGKISCPGYFDDELKRRVRCKGPEDESAIARVPWKDPMNLQQAAQNYLAK